MKTHTKAHTFIGQANTRATDGFAGFRLGQVYELRYERKDNGTVLVELDHMRGGGQLAMTAAEFEVWFSK